MDDFTLEAMGTYEVKDALSIEMIMPKISKLFGYVNENNFPAPELCPDVEIRNSYSKRKGAHGFYVKYIPEARALLIAKILLVCQTEQEWHWEYESGCAVFKDSPFVLYIEEIQKSANEDIIWHLMKSKALSVIMKDYINTKWSTKGFDEIKKFDRKFDPTKTFFSYSDCRDLGISNTVDKLVCNKGLSVYRQAFKDTVLNRIIDMSRNALIANDFEIESISGVSVLRGGIDTRKHIGRVCAEWYRDYLQEKFPSEKMKKLLVYNLPCKEESWEYCHFVVFRKLDDELAVLRVYQYPEIMFSGYLTNDLSTFNLRTFGRFLGKRPSEELRIYVDKKGEVRVMRKNLGHWRVTTANSVRADTVVKENPLMEEDLAFKVINLSEMLKWTPLRYVYDEIKDELGCISVRKLVGFLRHPILEKISKAGYRRLADAMLHHPKGMRELGYRHKTVSNKKGKSGSVYKLLGVNKYILQEAENYIVHSMEKWFAENDALGIIVSIKDVMQTWDISFLSEESVKRMFRIIPNFFGQLGLFERYDIRRYLPADMEHVLNIERISKVRDNVRILNKLFNISEKEGRENSISLFYDAIEMYGSLLRSELSGEFYCNARDIDIWDFDDKNDILRIHNAICDLYNQMEAQRTERRKNMKADDPVFKELQRIRIPKYECTDGIFSIVVPKEMTEISKEGVRLHHCVGSYAQSVFHGYTDILFLRRNEDIDTSFYTIEVQNGRLEQIHGLYNRWLGNSPEAIPFVYKWLNERGIVFEKKILLNTGKGYCSGSKDLDESYLYETAEKAG